MTTYDFESGSAGNAANPTNTGLSTIVAGGGHSVTIDNVGVISGSRSLSFVAGNTTAALYGEAPAESGSPTQVSVYVGITLPPDGYSVDTTVWQQFLADGTTTVCRITVSAAGALKVTDQGTAHTITLVADITGKYGSTIGVRLLLDSGTTTSNGSVTAKYYATPTLAAGSATATSTASNWNLGAGGIFGKSRFGINSTQSSLGTNGRKTTFDYYTIQAGTTLVPAPSAPTAPTADAGPDQYGPSSTGGVNTVFTLAGSGTPGSSGGSIVGYAWTVATIPEDGSTPSISNASVQNPQVSNLSPGVYRFNLTVQQSGGGLSSPVDGMNIWVHPPSGQPVTVKTVTKAAGITREGSATTDSRALNDTDPASLLRWPDSPAGEVTTIVFNPCGPSNPTFSFEGARVGAGIITRTINWFWEDGTTALDGPYSGTLGTTVGPLNGTTSGLSNSAVTALGTGLVNRRALVAKISDVAS